MSLKHSSLPATESVPVAIWETNRNGRIIDFFVRRPDLLQCDEREALGRFCWELGGSGRFAWPVRKALSFRNKVARWRQGERCCVLLNAGSPLYDEHGELRGFRGSLSTGLLSTDQAELAGQDPSLQGAFGGEGQLKAVLQGAHDVWEGICLGAVQIDDMRPDERALLARATDEALLAWAALGTRYHVYSLDCERDISSRVGVAALRSLQKRDGVRLSFRWEFPVINTDPSLWIDQIQTSLNSRPALVNLVRM